jgi:hypothetical protein
MDTVVVTTCSANHLAQANALGDSLLKYNPGYKYVIGLADKLSEAVKKDFRFPYEIIQAEDLKLPAFNEMYKRYNTFELNCALKSFFLDHVMRRDKPAKLLFMDSDVLAFHSLDYITGQLNDHSILLTPHIFSPFPADSHKPQERDILKAGLYNAGFIALKNDQTGNAFLKWWTDRMVDQCYERPKMGWVVDQNWLNFAPIYFDNVLAVSHLGCNVAYWNLHERKIDKRGNEYFVNDEYPLLFFHFSGYQFSLPEIISRHGSRQNMRDFPMLKELFDTYHGMLRENRHAEMLKIPCYYRKKKTWMQKLGMKK